MYTEDAITPEMDTYRLIEKVFRRLKSVNAAISASRTLSLFTLHHDPSESSVLHLSDGVTLYRSYLDRSSVHALTTQLLTTLLDPPHDSNLRNAPNQPASLYSEYLASCASGDFTAAALRRLRWACSGLHYAWTTRTYNPENSSPIAASIEEIYAQFSASTANLSCLANFYHQHRSSDRLGGHRDDVEASRSPLVLVSLGSPGLLLLGLTQGVILYSGDVLVLRDEGRDVLHGVPCVLHGSKGPPDGSVEDLLMRTRISLSIRNVFYPL